MSRDMFRSVVDTGVRVGTRKWYTVPLSILTHTAALAAFVVAPLMATGALPTPQTVLAFAASVPPPPPPPLPPPAAAAPPPVAPVMAMSPDVAPTVMPSRVAEEPPPTLMTRLVIAPTITSGAPAVALPEQPPPQPTTPIPVGGDIKSPTKIKNLDPVYPILAKQARIQGTVIIQAVIGRDGHVKDAQVLRSIPALDRAAVDAVTQWVYTPTLLGGRPIEVILTVSVNFALR